MKKYFYFIITVFMVFAVVTVDAKDDKSEIINQKTELKQIKDEVEQSKKKLDSLRNSEMNVQKEISDYDQKISSNRKIINRLTRELDQLKENIYGAEMQLNQRQETLDRVQRRYLGNIRQFYFLTKKTTEPFIDDPNRESGIKKQIMYLNSLADFESGNIEEASEYLIQSVDELENLSGKKKEVSNLKKQKEVSYSLDKSRKQNEEKKLDRLRRKSMDEADRIFTLEKAAREMEAIIARLEEEQERVRRQQQGSTTGSVFAALQGQLLSPYRGKIIVPFGNLQDPVTKLKSFSPGITIQGKAGGAVYSVAAGIVAYTGNLRGYGNFVIINHDNQYYTTYAGLERMFVSQDQHLQAGTKLGLAAEDGQVKFELRQGREPLDPVKWIKIESL
ncbi:MAG: peptidoglycan DD-metalloendopeptidase family protein [candidate division Zixibacteria bacterium]|nr:peptidoglycan DD-metalloendopeptidase family protein [candidate division Zixibacteria bacterium]